MLGVLDIVYPLDSIEHTLRSNTYKLIGLSLGFIILAGLLGYVVPQIVEVYADSEQELPGLTILIISTSEFVVDFGI